MSQQESKNGQSPEAWDSYWEGAAAGSSFTAGGVLHPGFAAFWQDALTEFLSTRPEASILDIGTGNGAVIDYLQKVPDSNLKNVSCVDLSKAAVDGVLGRFPDVTGVVADAGAIPLDAGSFDLITSQFGVEYAGSDGIDEAARLLAPGGHLMLLLHVHSGALHQRSLEAIDALMRVRLSNFVSLAYDFFEAGFAAVKGADRTAYDSAAKALNPAITELDAILSQHGEHVADGTIVYLYTTVQKMHSRIQYYDAEESLAWLRTMGEELKHHEERMLAMDKTALDQEGVEAIRTTLVKKGLMPSQAQPLLFEGDPLPFAWVLQAANIPSAPDE